MRTVIEPEAKQRVRDAVRSACEISAGNCLDLVFKVLLGRELDDDDERGRSRGGKAVFWDEKAAAGVDEVESSDSESDEDEDDETSAVQSVLTKENLRRPCGATFGFGGQSASVPSAVRSCG